MSSSGGFGLQGTVNSELSRSRGFRGQAGPPVVHLFELMQFNTHGITESTDALNRKSPHPEFENKIRTVGDGLYPTVCLLNHSCDTNVYKYFSGDTIVVVASKNIEMGDEVTEGYFPSVQVIPRDERRMWLAEHYMFYCKCSACEEDMPGLDNVSPQYVNFHCGENQEDIDRSKVDLEKLKEELASTTSEDQTDREKYYQDIKDIWIRYQKLVKHPYKGLYKTEQLFWKAIRTTFGNQAIRE